MDKESLTLTEAIRRFNEQQSARAADQLHALFPVSQYLLPVAADHFSSREEAVERLENMENVPFLVIQHPEVGNYIPVFTGEEEAKKAELPENSICASVDFDRLVDILEKTGPNIQAVIFDPAENSLLFSKPKFLKYAHDLTGKKPAKAQKPRPERKAPAGEVKESIDGSKKLGKDLLRYLKKEARKDSRVRKAWLVRQSYDNGAVVWNLIIDGEGDQQALLDKFTRVIAPHLLKRDFFQPAIVCEELEPMIESVSPFYLA